MNSKKLTLNFMPVFLDLTDLIGLSDKCQNIKDKIKFHLERVRLDDGRKAFAWVRWDGNSLDAFSNEHGDWYTFLGWYGEGLESAGLLTEMIAEQHA